MGDEEPDARGSAAEAEGEGGRPGLTRKEFLERAMARAGQGRKGGPRAAIDAALATLAEALGEGREVNLPPLGKLRVVKEREGGKGRVLTLRLALPRAPAALAEAEENV